MLVHFVLHFVLHLKRNKIDNDNIDDDDAENGVLNLFLS